MHRPALAILSGFVILSVSLQAQGVLKITSPAEGTVVAPGDTLSVTVSVPPDVKAVVIIGKDVMSAPVSAPPYEFIVPVPNDTPLGVSSFSAVSIVDGKVRSSDPVTIIVRRRDSPVSGLVEPSSLELRRGQQGFITVTEKYSDGLEANVTQAPWTKYVSSAPSVATVDRQGIVTAVASGSAAIVVNDAVKLPVTVAPEMTLAPGRVVLHASQRQHFFPRRADYSALSVTWAIEPEGFGTISETGEYVAPGKISSTQAVVITAIDKSNPAITATASVEVVSTAAPVSAGKPSCGDFRLANTFGMMQLLDPIPDLISDYNFITDADALAVAAHGGGIAIASMSFIRVRANFAGEQIQISVLDDAGNVSGTISEYGSLASLPDTGPGATLPFKSAQFVPGQITASAVQTNHGPMAFALYQGPEDFVRTVADEDKASREFSFRVESLDLPCYKFTWPK